MELEDIKKFKPGSEKITIDGAEKLSNELATEIIELILSKIMHIEPKGMFNVALDTSIYILTSVFSNVILNFYKNDNHMHEDIKSSIIDSVSKSLANALDLFKDKK